jgi:hypothetical protein
MLANLPAWLTPLFAPTQHEEIRNPVEGSRREWRDRQNWREPWPDMGLLIFGVGNAVAFIALCEDTDQIRMRSFLFAS